MLFADIGGDFELAIIPDVGHNERWVKQIEDMSLGFKTVYSGNPAVSNIFSREGYKVVGLPYEVPISGTKIRGLMYADREWEKWVGSGTAKVVKESHGPDRIKKFPESRKNFGAKLTVDGIGTNENGDLVLIERGHPPYRGQMAFPGGHIDYGEDPRTAVIREGVEETNLEFMIEGVVGIYSDVERDPRGWYCTIVYHGKWKGTPKAGDDAENIKTVSLEEASKMNLAFDHKKILGDYLKIKRGAISKL